MTENPEWAERLANRVDELTGLFADALTRLTGDPVCLALTRVRGEEVAIYLNADDLVMLADCDMTLLASGRRNTAYALEQDPADLAWGLVAGGVA
jgi:hypothetical protein